MREIQGTPQVQEGALISPVTSFHVHLCIKMLSNIYQEAGSRVYKHADRCLVPEHVHFGRKDMQSARHFGMSVVLPERQNELC